MRKKTIGFLIGLSLITLPHIASAEDTNTKVQELKKQEIIPENGVDLKVKSVKTYYQTFSGEEIEYTEENKDLILKHKLEDLKEYNSNRVAGQKKLTLADLGSYEKVDHTVLETEDEAIVEVAPSTSKKFSLMDALPPSEQKIEGRLLLVQNVNYLGLYKNNRRYLYNTYAEWIQKPSKTSTDALATAWDVDAKSLKNSFEAQQYMYSPGPGTAPGQEKTVTLKADGDELQTYGHGVKFKLEDYATTNVYMNRTVRVSRNLDTEPASVISKYHHTTFKIPFSSIGINLPGGSTINFDTPNGGTTTVVEYDYNYGDTNR